LLAGAWLLGMSVASCANAADSTALELEATIPLGNVRGRIDHLAIDLARHTLYVAELGNDSVGVVDLEQRKTVNRLTGLDEPQGIGYVPSTDTLYVACAGDGVVRLFQGPDLKAAAQVALGQDADNVRVDDAARRVFVGYGEGAIAVIDTASGTRVGDIPLRAHPESFQLSAGQHMVVNVPDAHEIALVDRAVGKQIASWPTGELRANFAMAIDEVNERVLIAFRHPPTLGVYRADDGVRMSTVETCADADDVFADDKRHRLYVSCGEGFEDVYAQQGAGYVRIARVTTSPGSRTALYSPQLDRLFVAERSAGGNGAAVRVYRPVE